MSMQQQQQRRSNGNGGQQPKQRQITDHLDALEDILQSSQNNPLLQQTNLGQGNYDEDYLWQQIQSYRDGLFAHKAFSSLVEDRHLRTTKLQLGRSGVRFYDTNAEKPVNIEPFDQNNPEGDKYLRRLNLERDVEYYSTWTLIQKRGEYIWREELGDPEAVGLTEMQAAALVEISGDDGEWLPIYWEMVAGRHEASRSLDSTLIKFVLGDYQERRADTGEDSGSLLPGRS